MHVSATAFLLRQFNGLEMSVTFLWSLAGTTIDDGEHHQQPTGPTKKLWAGALSFA